MWSVNYGVDDRGNVDKTEWFTSQGLPALAALLKRDAAAINSGGEHDKAIARRALIFCVDENLFEVGAQGATTPSASKCGAPSRQTPRRWTRRPEPFGASYPHRVARSDLRSSENGPRAHN